MMAKGIRAGRAFVEMGLEYNELNKGLLKAQQKLEDFGKQATFIGTRVAAIGAIIAAPFIAAVKMFTDLGDQTAKTARSLGLTTEAFSNFSFAADRSGASAETFSSSLMKMQKYIYDAESGTKEAKDSFAALGLNLNELMQMAPEKQFMAVADALNNISNPTEKAALAMRVFGRGVRELLPMLAEGSKGMQELFEQNKALGGEIGTRTATGAEILDDAFTDLWQSVKGLAMEIGETLAPYVKNAVKFITEATAAATKWVSKHENAIIIIGTTAAVVGALGVGLIALGGAALIGAQGVALLNIALAVLNAHPVVAVITIIAAAFIAIAGAVGIATTDIGKFNDEIDESIKKANKLKEEQEALARQAAETAPEKQPKTLTDADIKRRRDQELDALYSLKNEQLQAIDDKFTRELNLIDNRYTHEIEMMRRSGTTQLAIDAKLFEYAQAQDNLRAEFRKQKAEEENKIREEMAKKREDELNRQKQIQEQINLQNESNVQEEARLQLQLQYQGLELKLKELDLEERIAVARAESNGEDIDTIKRVFYMRKQLAEIEDKTRNKTVEKAIQGTARGIFNINQALSLASPKIPGQNKMGDDIKEMKNLTKDIARNTRITAENQLEFQ